MPKYTITLAAIGLLAGCAGPRGALGPTTFPPLFEHRPYPFVVRDTTGSVLEHAFMGGLNLPRPQFADIDGDGDHDLFVQELTGEVKFFENAGSASQARFVWRTDQYLGIDVGEWYRFVDIDGDGDYDLLGEMPYSYIRLFRNEGSRVTPHFVPDADSLRDVDGVPLFADRQNIPHFTDLDCDGQMDLFVGRVDGTVRRYESIGMDERNIPRFRMVTDRFEDIEIVSQFGTMHGANTLTFHDIDADGDLDLFWGDFFEPGVLLIPNTGTCAEPNLRSEPLPFPTENPLSTSGYNAPIFTDIDADGDEDFFVGVLGGAFNPNHTSAENLYFLEADGHEFTLRTRTYLKSIDIGAETIPTFADLDGDGDLDLLLSNKIEADAFDTAAIYRFENQAGEAGPEFVLRGRLEISGRFHYAPAIADLDGDGDPDMLAGTWNKGIAYFRNDGSAADPAFTLVQDGYVKLTRGSNSTPALVDIDADGDMDLFIGESSGDLNFYRNAGNASQPAFELVSDKFDGIDVGRRSTPTFADLDADGDMDLIVGREGRSAALYRNVGTAEQPLFEDAGSLDFPLPIYAVPKFADIDGDGDLDLFSGGLGGGLVYYENMTIP